MAKTQILNFLLIYDRGHGELLETRSYETDIEAALADYREMEKAHAENRAIDIVLVGSDSLDTVRVTHASYFTKGGVNQIEDYLRNFVEQSGVQVD